MEELKSRPGMPTRTVIGIAVLVAVVFGGGTYAYVSNKATKEKNDLNAQITELQKQVAISGTTVTPSSSTSTTADPTSNWKTALVSDLGISFKYPSDWGSYEIVNEGAEKGASKRLVFSSDENKAGYSSKTALITYVTKGFEAGRSGSLSEALSFRAVAPACDDYMLQILESGTCKEVQTSIGTAITGTKSSWGEGDETTGTSLAVIYRASQSYPYFSVEKAGKNTDIKAIVSNIIASIKSI